MTTMENLQGGCMCGAVRYETRGDSWAVIHCHCQSCRKHTGAPVATMAVYKADQVTFVGNPRKIYQSSPGAGRAFCPDCGTPLTWEREHGDVGPVCALHAGTFDDPEKLTPTSHSFYPERISWLELADDLPRHEGFIANSPLLHVGPPPKEG